MPLVGVREGIIQVSRRAIEEEYSLHCALFREKRKKTVAWVFLDGFIVFLSEEMYRRIERKAEERKKIRSLC